MFDIDQLMKLAIGEAEAAAANGEVPVGAVLTDANGNVVAAAHNRVEEEGDVTAHAELLVLKQAAKVLKTPYFNDCTLAVTLEPCAMCAQAISWAQVGTVYFGAHDVKSGGVVNGARVFDHAHFKPEVYGGIWEEECRRLMQVFFEKLRDKQ